MKHNFTVEKQHVEPLSASDAKLPRSNILAYPGNHRNTRILLSTHIDTVPPYLPYHVRNGDEIWGRGSVDAKACVATQITAVEQLLASGDIGQDDVSFLFVVGEEIGGDGMRSANDLDLKWETVIFGEPTELKLASGHKGIISFHAHAQGKAAHSGYPELGVSANSMMIPVLMALEKLELPSSNKYGNSTLNIGIMEGGVAENVLAEEANGYVTIRIAAGTPEKIKDLVSKTIGDINDKIDVKFMSEGYGPVYIDSDIDGYSSKPRLSIYNTDIAFALGFEKITVNYGTDIPNLQGDHKRYLYGPGSILVAHSDHEHLQISDLVQAVEGYKRIIRTVLK